MRVIGQFVAKAMLDSRIIDLSFNKIFLKLVLGEDVPLTIATLKVSFFIVNTMDSILTCNTSLLTLNLPTLSLKSKASLQTALWQPIKYFHIAYCFVSSTQRALQLSQKVAKIEQVSIEDLALDFTIPGYDIELRVRI